MLGSPPPLDDNVRRRRRSPFAPAAPAAPPPAAPLPPPPPTRESLREKALVKEAQRERHSRRARPGAGGEKGGPTVLVIPVRRLVALATGGFAALLAIGLIMGAQTSGVAQRLPFAIVVFGAQVLYVFAATMAMRPPNGKIVAAVGVISAVGASYAVYQTATPTLIPLGIAAAGGAAVGILGQLMGREGRMRLTETVGSTLVIVVGAVSFVALLVLVRIPLGTQTIVVCLASCGVALSVARLTDVLAPYPRLADLVPRGAIGVIAGTMMGTAVAGYIGRYLVMFTPATAAIVGAIAAAAAVLADLTIGFAEAGRELEGDAPTMWLARHMQGPLAGFALTAPVAYVINSFLWTAS